MGVWECGRCPASAMATAGGQVLGVRFRVSGGMNRPRPRPRPRTLDVTTKGEVGFKIVQSSRRDAGTAENRLSL